MKTAMNRYGIVIVAAFIGAALCLYLAPQAANAQRLGPFTLVAHANNTANVGIFRVDQSSGAVSFCTVDDRTLATHCGAASE